MSPLLEPEMYVEESPQTETFNGIPLAEPGSYVEPDVENPQSADDGGTGMDPEKMFEYFSAEEQKAMMKAFKKYDKDGSGDLDPDEVVSALREVNSAVTSNMVHHLLKTYDKDGNGKVDFNEYIQMMAQIKLKTPAQRSAEENIFVESKMSGRILSTAAKEEAARAQALMKAIKKDPFRAGALINEDPGAFQSLVVGYAGALVCGIFMFLIVGVPVFWGMDQTRKGEDAWNAAKCDEVVPNYPNVLKATYAMNMIIMLLIVLCGCVYNCVDQRLATYCGACCIGLSLLILLACATGSWILFMDAAAEGCLDQPLASHWWKYWLVRFFLIVPLLCCAACAKIFFVEYKNQEG